VSPDPSAPEAAWAAEADPAHRRRFAQYFTPYAVAAFMARWVLDGTRRARFADPALGLGVFVRALEEESRAEGLRFRVAGFELDPAMADRAAEVLSGLPQRAGLRIERGDWLDSGWEARYDGILCNPPYLHFQGYARRRARIREAGERIGLKLAGLTNMHCLFLLKAVHQLAPGGRAAFVMPWEFLNAGYGGPVKACLLGTGALRHAVIFGSDRALFEGAVTTACILLMEKPADAGGGGREVAFHRVGSRDDLARLRGRLEAPAPAAAVEGGIRRVPAHALRAEGKWKVHWSPEPARDRAGKVPLSTFARVLRGIATGCNDFFVLDEAARAAAGLSRDCLLPCVAGARDAAGPVFRAADFDANLAAGRRAWLLDAAGREEEPAVRAYLEAGRRLGAHERYLTRRRSPWYALEERPPAPLWVSVFNRGGGLRPVLNRAGVRNLTAFHCVYMKPGAEPFAELLFVWLLTAKARALVREQAREYGSGLEKIEPMDLAAAPVPDFARMREADREAIRLLAERVARDPGSERECSDLAGQVFDGPPR
jgi:adenine-specific DNA-methyltransferase